MHPPRCALPSTLRGIVVALGLLTGRLEAQRLAPVTDDQRCHGGVVVGVTFRGIRRELVPRRLDPVARVANKVALTLQPPTRARLISRFLLLGPGAPCEEQARAESESILRAQPYISDAAIRAVTVGQDSVRLDVETIDEYVFYFESWGWEGLPSGAEVGTGNFAGTGRTVRLLGELGRGGHIGWGALYRDYQFTGRPITFEAQVRSTSMYDNAQLALTRPWYSNYQRDSWSILASQSKVISTFRDADIRDVSIDYQRTRFDANWTRRVGGLNEPVVVSLLSEWERARPVRILQIRENGPVPVPLPPELERYGLYYHARVGAGVGFRRLRFLPVRALNALSAPEDVPIGLDSHLGVKVGIPALQQGHRDVVVQGSVSGAVGRPHALLRLGAYTEWIAPRAGSLPRQLSVNTKIGVSGKLTEAQITQLSFETALASRPRLPTQLTFRDGLEGVIGFRSTDIGGAQRAIARFEERHRIPSPIPTIELGLAALLQSGRIWAGDAPFGTNTGWRHGAGIAILAAIPKGSKQTLRIEIGRPLNPTPGLQGTEIRIVFSDFTGRF